MKCQPVPTEKEAQEHGPAQSALNVILLYTVGTGLQTRKEGL